VTLTSLDTGAPEEVRSDRSLIPTARGELWMGGLPAADPDLGQFDMLVNAVHVSPV